MRRLRQGAQASRARRLHDLAGIRGGAAAARADYWAIRPVPCDASLGLELFRLAVLSLALGVAYGATELFGVSFALGAFFAGMVLAESELSHPAAEESLPLRDAF